MCIDSPAHNRNKMKTNFRKNIRFVVLKELAKALKARHKGDYSQEFIHLEHAHVLGQNSTYWHTKIHCLMFAWARRQADKKEYIGQLLRIAGAVSKTAMGAVPQGNTGGSHISPFKSLPLRESHARAIARAQAPR
tara:strand:- start:2596 stop:3000 length:405 start_codon:yes stop_codon:yes gene_type:complete